MICIIPIKIVQANETFVNHSNKESSYISSEIEIPIFGYKLDVKQENPIERDDWATLIIHRNHEKSLDIEIQTKFGNFHYDNLILEEEL